VPTDSPLPVSATLPRRTGTGTEEGPPLHGKEEEALPSTPQPSATHLAQTAAAPTAHLPAWAQGHHVLWLSVCCI